MIMLMNSMNEDVDVVVVVVMDAKLFVEIHIHMDEGVKSYMNMIILEIIIQSRV